MSRITRDRLMMANHASWGLAAARVIVATVAAMVITGPMAWADQARERFRDEVLGVLDQRFHVPAKAVPGDPDAIEIRGHRRDLRRLFDRSGVELEPRRRRLIYEWFLGDAATTGRFKVREQPFSPRSDEPPPENPALGLVPKRVKPLRISPDGSEIVPRD